MNASWCLAMVCEYCFISSVLAWTSSDWFRKMYTLSLPARIGKWTHYDLSPTRSASPISLYFSHEYFWLISEAISFLLDHKPHYATTLNTPIGRQGRSPRVATLLMSLGIWRFAWRDRGKYIGSVCKIRFAVPYKFRFGSTYTFVSRFCPLPHLFLSIHLILCRDPSNKGK